MGLTVPYEAVKWAKKFQKFLLLGINIVEVLTIMHLSMSSRWGGGGEGGAYGGDLTFSKKLL